MATSFERLDDAQLRQDNRLSPPSNEARGFVSFMRENHFKDLYAKPEAYYAALEREREAQHNLPSNLNEYPLPAFVRERVKVQAESTPGGHGYLTLLPKDNVSRKAILHICGGGFMSQPMESHWDMLCCFVQELSCKIAVPLHPLLPDSSFHQAKSYLLGVFEAVRASCNNLILAGDSSGGWCALSLALWARELDLAQPEKLVLISPLLDLSDKNNAMRDSLNPYDEMLSPWGIAEAGRLWTPDFQVRNAWPPSPAFASLEGIAPIDIIVGGNEILLADVRLLQACTKTSLVRVAAYPGMWHAFPLFAGIPESEDARNLILESIRQC